MGNSDKTKSVRGSSTETRWDMSGVADQGESYLKKHFPEGGFLDTLR